MTILNISLPPDLEEWVKAKVQSGQYNSVSEAVHHGLYLMQDQDALRKEIAVAVEAAERGEVEQAKVTENGR